VAEVQHVLNKSPKGIPLPKLQPIIMNDTITPEEKGLIGDWSLYNKQIGVISEVPYPIMLKNTKEYFKWIEVEPSFNPSERNFLFTENPTESQPLITSFTGNKLAFKILSSDSNNIALLQAYYPHWYYNNGKEKKKVLKGVFGLIYIPIAKGENEIIFSFEPKKVIVGMIISLTIFCGIIILLLLNPPFIRRSLYPS
ncbi:MAG: hypothetical protein M3004_08770, partial [Bacteroidota bacterium]|nr:hypothetical protein [Bacteroidota bacterium]